MSDEITIRDAVPSDKDAIAAMILDLNRHEHTISPDRNLTANAGHDQYDYAAALVEDQGGFILIADANGDFAGCLIGIVQQYESHYMDPGLAGYGDVFDLFVAETHRGQGLAARLLAEAEKRFKAMGLTSMELFVLAGNESAIAAYKKHGFGVQDFAMRKKI